MSSDSEQHCSEAGIVRVCAASVRVWRELELLSRVEEAVGAQLLLGVSSGPPTREVCSCTRVVL